MPPSRSRPAAFLGALSWALGTFLFPALHLARHVRPHDHEGGGIRYHVDEAEEHAHAVVDGVDDHDDDAPGGPATVEAPHGHRHPRAPHAAGLSHFLAATGDGAERAVELGAVRAEGCANDALPERSAVFFLEGKRAARAPPAG